jgi:hypothetical protein
MSRRDRQLELLLAYMTEHYEHARSHEHLRSNMSALSTAAAFAIIGAAVQLKHGDLWSWLAAGAIVVAIAGIGMRISAIHRNRSDAHGEAAGEIRKKLENELWLNGGLGIKPSDARKKFDTMKSPVSLNDAWDGIHFITIIIGLVMILVGVAQR